MSEPQEPTAGSPQAGDAPPGYAPPGYASPGYAPPPGYGQQGYGPRPGYGQPYGYGTPPGYPPMGYPRPTNTMAILALVLAFVVAPAGLVLGIIARRQIDRTGEEGAGMALAGIIIGAIFTALYALVIVFWIIALTALSSGSFGP